MQVHRIIDVGEVSARMFALGLDTLEIAGVLGMSEAAILKALDAEPAPEQSQTGSAPQ